jgi:hypothetical protein
VNLFEQTEDFGNAYWEKGRVTLSTGLAPDGSAATVMTETAETGTHRVIRTTPGIAGTNGNTQYVLSAFYKSNTGTPLALLSMTDLFGTNQVRAWFNLTSGTVGTVENASTATGAAASIVAIGDGWYRCTLTGIINVSQQIVGFIGMAATDGVLSYLGNTGRSVLLWRPQIEVGSTTTPTAYQRVTTAFDVTEAGQRDCYGVRFDGTDDGYLTNSINLTGNDKLTVFASLFKNSNSGIGTVYETSVNTGANNGSFAMFSPENTNRFIAYARGTNNGARLTTSSSFDAPLYAITTQQADIGADTHVFTINGVAATGTQSLGTGNFGNHVLYLGRRGGTVNPFNGNLYALIVAGGSYPLSTINRVRTLLSRITPTVNL